MISFNPIKPILKLLIPLIRRRHTVHVGIASNGVVIAFVDDDDGNDDDDDVDDNDDDDVDDDNDDDVDDGVFDEVTIPIVGFRPSCRLACSLSLIRPYFHK